MSDVTAMVFPVDDDVFALERPESSIHDEDRQRETFASARKLLDYSSVRAPNCPVVDLQGPFADEQTNSYPRRTA